MTVAIVTCFFLLQSLTPEVIEHAQAGAEAQHQGRFDVAIQEFRKVTALQPDSAAGYANLGNAYFQNRDYDAAIPELEHALRLSPNLTGTHQALGVILLVQGNAADALPHLEKTRDPALLGLAYLETGRLGSAIMALQAALERQPNDPDLLYYFGRATALAAKRTFSQLAAMKPDLTQKPDLPQKNVPAQDVVTLQTALAKRPDDPGLLRDFNRAATLASNQAFDKIIKASAGSARAHQVAAERYVEMGRLPPAEQEYTESVRLNPYTSGVHLALGNILAAEGKWPGAVAQFQVESILRPRSAEALYRLGSALLQQGQAKDTARAEQAWMRLLAIDQKSDFAAQAHFGLAALYRNAGKTAEADREMALYQELKTGGQH